MLRQLKSYYPTVIPLLILWGFVHHFNIEVQFNLPLIFPLIIGSFIIHAVSPIKFRKVIFIFSTFIGLGLIMSFSEVLTLLVIAFAMIGICNLDIQLRVKKILLLIIAILFGLMNAGIIPSWTSSNVLTVLASMFMFRMLLLLYEMKHQKEPIPFLTQVSYFMMIPNVVFPLFPVVDYKLFQRSYYDQADTIIYQRGIGLIAKGILHMFLYRIIYSYLLPSGDEVNTLTGLLSFIFFNYLLVIRLSGLFHFSVGVMCLFGYNLPEIFNNIFIAKNFSDLWRRLNIYWKDFVVKVFFNPMYFKLKKFGTKKALFWSTIFSFVVTMVLHSYQTFWLVGVFRLSIKDVIFWLFFGCMVALLTLSQSDQNGRPVGSFSKSIKRMTNILLTFTTMAFMWSLWSSQSLESWLELLNVAQKSTIYEIIILLSSIPIFILAGASVLHWASTKKRASFNAQWSLNMPLSLIVFVLLIMCFNSWSLKSFWDGKLNGNDIHYLFHFTLKESDSQNEIAGYYDNILSASDLMSPLVNNTVTKSKSFQVNLYQQNIVVKSSDAFKRKFTPLSEAKIQDVEVSINRWGMYDKDYEKKPAKGIYRIAVLGGSIEMGWTVPNEQSLGKVIERRLNEELNSDVYSNFEVLNFSVPSRSILNQSYALQKQVLDFKPHMVLFFDHDETEWINIVKSIQEYDYSKDIDGYIDSIYTNGTLTKNKTTTSALRDFEKHREPLIQSIYQNIYDLCSKNDITPLLVAMPEIRAEVYDRKYKHPEIAKRTGFMMIDLSDIFEPELVASYSMDRVGHPTKKGNELITNALYQKLETIIKKQTRKKQ